MRSKLNPLKVIILIMMCLIIGCTFILLSGTTTFFKHGNKTNSLPVSPSRDNQSESTHIKALQVERITFSSDKDQDGLNDLDDIVEGARKDVKNRTRYKSKYYNGGYPPDYEGVCTDVIWKALKNAGYILKDMMDADIKANPRFYPGVNNSPDPNIDFRRVKNQLTFFTRFATSLTRELKPGDAENLKEWQGGDIVTFDHPEHTGILSTKRNRKGIPYLIHNAGPRTRESDDLLHWYDGITGHFRFPKVLSSELKLNSD